MPAPSAASTIVRLPNEDVDARDNRTVYHRGDGLRMTSTVDKKGRLLKAMCIYNTDVVSWMHGATIRTGVIPKHDADFNQVTHDKLPSGMRLERVRSVVGAYSGNDKYVKGFARLLLTAGTFASADVVTGMGYVGDVKKKRQQDEYNRKTRQMALLAGLGVLLVFALVYALRH
ncbi:MAG: hypothetical protein QM723_14025 [Myxococcaceae bacterium]